MATISPTPEINATKPAVASLLVSLAALPRESIDLLLENLAAAFPGESLVVATADASASTASGSIQLVTYAPPAPSTGGWTLTAADFLNAYELASQHEAKAVLLLGSEAQSLTPDALRRLANSILD